jgi:hypothetical protein
MIKKVFSRYSHEMKEALKKGDDARLLVLASRSADLIARMRHDLGQYCTLASRSGGGRFGTAMARLRSLSTIQEKELAFFTLFFFAGRQKDAAAMNELLAAYRDLFLAKTAVVREPGCVPSAAWSAVLAPALELGVDPAVIFPAAGHAEAAGGMVLAAVQRDPWIDDASWKSILEAATKAGVEYSFLQKAAVQLVERGRPEPALAAVESIKQPVFRMEAMKALVAALTAAGFEMEAFEAFLEMGKDAETYQDELAMPILDGLLNQGRWPEAFRILLKLPSTAYRGDVAQMIVARLAAQEAVGEEVWKMLVAVIDTLPIYNKNSLRAKLIRGLAGHGMHEAALVEVNKLESDKLRQDGMMLLMGQMRESGAAPEKVREMFKEFNTPEGLWSQPAEPPLPSISGMLADFLHESGFVGKLRQVSEIFGDFCGRAPAYKRLLAMGLEDEAFGEALEMGRADRKMTALAEIAQALQKKGRAEEVETVLQYGFKQCSELEHQGEKARCLAELALGLAKTGSDARAVFSEALALVQMIPEQDHKIWPLERIVVCEARADNAEKAREHLDLLLEIFAAPGIEEKEERLSDLIGELVEANAIDVANQALNHFMRMATAEPDGHYFFKLFCRLRRIKIVPGWVILALISLSAELDEKAAAALLWDVNDLAIDKKQWDLAIAANMKMAEYEIDSSCFYFLQKALLDADVPGNEVARLVEAHQDVFSIFSSEGSGWLVTVSLLLKAGLAEKATEILQIKLGENLNKQSSPCEKELREMDDMIASSAGSLVSVVPWALSFLPAMALETGAGGNDVGEADQEHWNRLFSSLIEKKGLEERCSGLNALFWNVPRDYAATFANILAYHPLILRLPAILALARRAIAEQDRALAHLAVPLAYDCRDAVEICRLALRSIPTKNNEPESK